MFHKAEVIMEAEPGTVFHAAPPGSFNNYSFYLVFNKSNEPQGDNHFLSYEYDVVSVFSYQILKSGENIYFNSSIFGQLYNQKKLHLFPLIIQELMETRDIYGLIKHGLNLDALSYSISYRDTILKPYLLEFYPSSIHRWAHYFLSPLTVRPYKHQFPYIQLD